MKQPQNTAKKHESETGISWPGGARCAVMISFDPDGETLFRSGPKGADWAWPRSRSIGRYGPHRGLHRILEMLDRKQVPATFFVTALTAANYPEVFKEIHSAGHEIGHHGYNHELFNSYTREEQKEIIEKSQDVFDCLTGQTAKGFRTPSGDFSFDTPELLLEMGFSYSSSMRGDDRPYRTMIHDKPSDLIEIPAKWELDDYPQFGYNFYPADPVGQDRIMSNRAVLENWRMEFEGYYRYGLCYVIMLHPQLSGMPGRLAMVEELIDTMQSYPDVWFASGSEIADWWRTQTKGED
ncbi:MAG: polysaccharide deacetylase [Lachnospiraceae bacterium]|nr:polysaccharide deacetylase [Lachnospiraceae bacterium]